MTKSEVLSKLDLYKNRPIEVAINGAGDITVYSNMEGRWLFTDADGIVAIAKNVANGKYELGGSSQREFPFTIMHIPYDDIVYVKSYIPYEDVTTTLQTLTPVGTDKSLADLINEITSDSIYKASSPRGVLNTPYNAPGGSYGRFMGSAISTDIDGLPKYYDDMVNDNE